MVPHDFLLANYPLYKLCDNKYNEDSILNNIKDIKYSINFNSHIILLEKNQILSLIKHLLEKTKNSIGKLKKMINTLLIFKILFDNPFFAKENNSFKNTVEIKLKEFRKSDVDNFNLLSPVNNNINPLETMTQLFSIHFSDKLLLEMLFEKFETVYDLDYLCNNHLILSLHPESKIINVDIKLNFKVINNLDKITFNKVNYSISCLINNEVCILAIYENFINNINYLQNNNKLKESAKNNLKHLINNYLSNFNKYKKYSNDTNPLIILNNLFTYLLN